MRNTRIPTADFIDLAGDLGVEVNVNHEHCPAGADTKKRLYIKRVDNGIIAYCHNCGLSGWYMNGHSRVRRKEHVEITRASDGPKYDETYFGKFDPISPGGHNSRWLAKYPEAARITPLLRCAPAVDGCPIVYPLYSENRKLYGYQLRWTDGTKPKTKTYLNEKPHVGAWSIDPLAPKKSIVLVEDPLSGIIVHNVVGTKCDVVSLLGTHLTPAIEIAILASKYERAFVYLDPDMAGEKAADKICKRLSFLDIQTYDIRVGDKQPKECTAAEIDGVILDV